MVSTSSSDIKGVEGVVDDDDGADEEEQREKIFELPIKSLLSRKALRSMA